MYKTIRISVISCLMSLIPCGHAFSEEAFNPFAKARATEAVNNARQIGLALMMFDSNYGSFPSDKTLALVEQDKEIKLPADDKSSNALFRQLFAAGDVNDESLFFAKVDGITKGGVVEEAAKALGKGKNAFAYIAGLSTAGNPSRPIVVCPLIAGTTKFDPKPFGGKAVILRVDCSVQLLPIGEDGKVMVDGTELLSKDHPVWDGEAPDLRHPDLAPADE